MFKVKQQVNPTLFFGMDSSLRIEHKDMCIPLLNTGLLMQ